LQISAGEEGEVVLDFPQAITGGNQIYAFRFRTKVFLQSTQFKARLESSLQPGLSQETISGNASNAVATQSLVVVSQLKDTNLLENVELTPSVFTPNGDGVNDQTKIFVDIFHLERPKTLDIEVLDLSGHRVRNLSVQRSFPSGEHEFSWDGRDDQGQALPPGIYLVRVHFSTDSDAPGTAVSRLVHLVY
jgi:flagellar hook assembly protein FlgD